MTIRMNSFELNIREFKGYDGQHMPLVCNAVFPSERIDNMIVGLPETEQASSIITSNKLMLYILTPGME